MEGLVARVADRQPPVARQPGACPLDHPAMPPQPLLILHAPPRDAVGDPALAQGGAAGRVVVALVGVPLRGVAGDPVRPRERRQRVEQRREDGAVVPVGPGQPRREREALTFDQEVTLGTRPAAIRRVRADRVAPFLAALRALSMQARDRSSLPASSSRSNRTRWSRRQTPARSQARSRRQQVTPLPQPSSAGSQRHGIPVRSTKMMPHTAGRAGSHGRPPRGCAGCGGKSGAIAAHNSSETNSCTLMPPSPHPPCQGYETACKAR